MGVSGRSCGLSESMTMDEVDAFELLATLGRRYITSTIGPQNVMHCLFRASMLITNVIVERFLFAHSWVVFDFKFPLTSLARLIFTN